MDKTDNNKSGIVLDGSARNKRRRNLLPYFEKINEAMKEEGFRLNAEFFKKVEAPVRNAAKALDITPLQAVIFAVILEYSGDEAVSIDCVKNALRCSKTKALMYLDEMEALEKKRLIRRSRKTWTDPFSERGRVVKSLPSYIIPLDVIKALRTGRRVKKSVNTNISGETFFDIISDILDAVRDDEIDATDADEEISVILKESPNLAFAQALKNYNLGNESVITLLLFCTYLINGDETLHVKALRSYFDGYLCRRVERRFKSGEHKLIKFGLVENNCSGGLADSEEYCLTKKARGEFLTGIKLKIKKRNAQGLIEAKSIKSKNLFYSDSVMEHVNELASLLQQNNFNKIKRRLAAKKMRTGFACIFTGPPGTGKTETAYQLAKKTRRDLMLVDISQTKDKWFGESEKLIKSVFDRYQGLIKGRKRVPILLFNEADAVFSVRQNLDGNEHGPRQTENAIQNIILEQIENLDNGILIATTNLVGNLDKAFERRFLYKVEFEKPDVATRAKIWLDKFEGALSAELAATLAEKYNFSGAQIDNIARKAEVANILRGESATLELLTKLCKEELLIKEPKPIGFMA